MGDGRGMKGCAIGSIGEFIVYEKGRWWVEKGKSIA